MITVQTTQRAGETRGQYLGRLREMSYTMKIARTPVKTGIYYDFFMYHHKTHAAIIEKVFDCRLRRGEYVGISDDEMRAEDIRLHDMLAEHDYKANIYAHLCGHRRV